MIVKSNDCFGAWPEQRYFFVRRTVMLYKKISLLVLMMVLVSSVSAQVNDWTNGTGDGRWMDPNNWSQGVVPGPGTGNTRINPDTNADPNNLMGPTIRSEEHTSELQSR